MNKEAKNQYMDTLRAAYFAGSKKEICSDEISTQLKSMTSATIDRRLKHEKETLKLKGKTQKKSSFLLSLMCPLKPVTNGIVRRRAIFRWISWKVAVPLPRENMSIISLPVIFSALGGKVKR